MLKYIFIGVPWVLYKTFTVGMGSWNPFKKESNFHEFVGMVVPFPSPGIPEKKLSKEFNDILGKGMSNVIYTYGGKEIVDLMEFDEDQTNLKYDSFINKLTELLCNNDYFSMPSIPYFLNKEAYNKLVDSSNFIVLHHSDVTDTIRNRVLQEVRRESFIKSAEIIAIKLGDCPNCAADLPKTLTVRWSKWRDAGSAMCMNCGYEIDVNTEELPEEVEDLESLKF